MTLGRMTRRGFHNLAFVYLLPAAVAALLLLFQPLAFAQQPATLASSITFVWDANSETNLAGYICVLKSPGGSVTNVVKANETTATFAPPPALPAPWTVTVKAFNTLGLVSEPSVPLVLTAPAQTVGLRASVILELNASASTIVGAHSQDGHAVKMLRP